jgi:hypothetical protein
MKNLTTILLCLILILVMSSYKLEDGGAQTITISIDDTADPNAIPDLLARWNYTGANTGSAKAAFLKANIVNYLKSEVQQYRIIQATKTATGAVTGVSIPIN